MARKFDQYPHYDSESDDWRLVTIDRSSEDVTVEDESGRTVDDYSLDEWEELSGVTNRYYPVSRDVVEDPVTYIEDILGSVITGGRVDSRDIDVEWAMKATKITKKR